MGMKTSFAKLSSQRFTRNFGGSGQGVADPYVTGYHFIWMPKIPPALINYANSLYTTKGSSFGETDIQRVLSAACLSVTPPGGTLNRVEFTGLGGTKWAVPGNIDYGNSVSVKFLEFKDTPVLDIIHAWVKMIRDYRLGVTNQLIDGSSRGYSNITYSCPMYYWTTAPDGQSVAYYACYDGVFPTKDPQDLFTSDVESVGRLDVEIEFNVDHIWHEDWVYKDCTAYAKTFAADNDSYPLGFKGPSST